MTKKDYVAIAEIVNSQVQAIANNKAWTAQAVTEQIAVQLAGHFKADNDRFDYFRFIKACGLEK